MADQPFTLYDALISGAEVKLYGFSIKYGTYIDEENRSIETAFILTDPTGRQERYEASEEGATQAWQDVAKLVVSSELSW